MAYFRKTATVEKANILDSEQGLVLKTYEGTLAMAGEDGIIAKGTVVPANDATAVGIVFEDVDMDGDSKKPISIIVAGRIIENNLPEAVESAAKAPLSASGIYLV